MRKFVFGISIAILVAGGTVGFAYSGLLNVSATANEPEFVRWVLQTTRENSVRRRAEDITAPDLSNETQIAAGARAFNEMCSGCHGAPGRRPILGAQDMNPPPPNLAKVANQRTPSELFWVIKHGIRMTGMPAWSATHSDGQLWEWVAFIEQLPTLSAEDYEKLAVSDIQNGHGHDHGEAAHAEPETQAHGDHSH